MPDFRLGELFCGPGGIACGAVNSVIENHEYRIVHQWASDYDRDTCDTYVHNICPQNPNSVICEDVRELNLNMLGEIDALAFGFPCNDYSVVGEQRGMTGNFGPLYSYGIEALRIYHPRWFLAENVGGLRNANDGRAFEQILNDMQDAGYTIAPHLYKFEQYGVPQARHRIIIIGINNNENLTFRVPSPEPYKNIDNTCRRAA